MKLPIFVLVSALMMAPFSAFAIDTAADISLDLDMMSIAWADYDRGTLIPCTIKHLYRPGYLNAHNHHADKLYIDMDTETIDVADNAGGTYHSLAAHPITIDVMTLGSNGPHCPGQAIKGKTGVLIGVPDLYLAIERISCDGLYLDDHPYTPTTVAFTSMQKWVYTTGPLDDSKSVLSHTISGIQLRTHAYVGGYDSADLTPGGQLMPVNSNHRVLVIITAHKS